MANKNDSLKSKVTQALRDHPEWANQRDNTELYAAVGAETVAQKTSVRVFKKRYKRSDYDAPPGWNSHRSPTREEQPPKPSVEASVFKVSGKGDLTDKVVEYFKANSHKLEQRDNSELYAAVGADDKDKQNTARVVKSRLKKAVRESGLGVVAIEVKKDSIEAMAELEKELETIEVRLTSKQMKLVEVYHAGTTKTDAIMQVYGYSYKVANANTDIFEAKSVKIYEAHLKAKDKARSVRRKRRLEDLEFKMAESSRGSNFLEVDKKGNIRPKKIVDRSVLDGIKAYKDANVSLKFHDAAAISRNLRQSIGAPHADASGFSHDSEIRELWERFQDQTREDSLSARDLVNELTARDYKIKPALMAQLNYELAVMLRDGDDVPDLDSDATPDMFDFDNMDAALASDKRIQEFRAHNAKQLEFVKKREKQLKDFKEKRGYDNTGPMSGELTTSDDELPEVKDDFFAGDFDDGDFEGFKE